MIHIERFTNAYKESIIALILDIQQNEFNIPIQLHDQPDLENIEGYYFTGNGGFWIAIDKDDVVRTVGLLDIGNNEFALRKMFVKKT